MLTNTFLHLQGIGPATEKTLWLSGFLNWKDFEDRKPPEFSVSKWEHLKSRLAISRQKLASRPSFFTRGLPAGDHWRIFPQFRPVTAYLDIETSGLDVSSYITTIALYDGTRIKTYVHGVNLDEFPLDIMNYDVLVTYNGKTFDVPVIEKYFGMELHQAHIDLRYVLNRLGFKGGLKKCEMMLGVDRGELSGVDGYMAVILWNYFRETGNPRALETLLAYNIMDAVNLEILMVEAFNRHLKDTPFDLALKVPIPQQCKIEHSPDRSLVTKLSGQCSRMWCSQESDYRGFPTKIRKC